MANKYALYRADRPPQMNRSLEVLSAALCTAGVSVVSFWSRKAMQQNRMWNVGISRRPTAENRAIRIVLVSSPRVYVIIFHRAFVGQVCSKGSAPSQEEGAASNATADESLLPPRILL